MMDDAHRERPAVVLLSGGVDSAVVLAIARGEGFACHALTFDYGQRHRHEIKAAKRLVKAIGAAQHRIINLDLRSFGGSALTDEIDVPKREPAVEIGRDIPVTYVPARNTIFLSIALGCAEAIGAQHLFVGVNALDYSGYPDCRPGFIAAFERLANLATRAGTTGRYIRIRAPIIYMNKAQIIQRGVDLGVDFSMTHSCYDPSPDGLACGSCESCILRKEGFAAAGVVDPTRYIPREPPPSLTGG